MLSRNFLSKNWGINIAPKSWGKTLRTLFINGALLVGHPAHPPTEEGAKHVTCVGSLQIWEKELILSKEGETEKKKKLLRVCGGGGGLPN